MNKNNNNTVFI